MGRPDFGGRRPRGEALGQKKKGYGARWEVKVVRDYFGCGVLADHAKFGCADETLMAPPNSHDNTPPKILSRRELALTLTF